MYELIGEEVHTYVGEEPSGQRFNAPTFDSKGMPHNPMINAGAIMVCALLVHKKKSLNDIKKFYKEMSNFECELDEELYLEEKLTGYSNHALCSLMLANGAFPKKANAQEQKIFSEESLDLYF